MTVDKIDAFEKRMREKQDRPRPEAKEFPLTHMMGQALEREITLHQRCPNCKHLNKYKDGHLTFPIRFDLLGESVPMMVWVCNQCGALFAPQWGRRIIKDAIREEVKLHGRIEVDG